MLDPSFICILTCRKLEDLSVHVKLCDLELSVNLSETSFPLVSPVSSHPCPVHLLRWLPGSNTMMILKEFCKCEAAGLKVWSLSCQPQHHPGTHSESKFWGPRQTCPPRGPGGATWLCGFAQALGVSDSHQHLEALGR